MPGKEIVHQNISDHRRRELTAERNRLAARGELFQAVDKGEDPETVFPVYEKFAGDIVPSSVDSTPNQTREEALRHIFAKDQTVARKFQAENGVLIRRPDVVEIYNLADLIKEEEDMVEAIEVDLTAA